MDDLPTPVRHTAHGNLPESCRISSPSPEAMNFVLVMFTWRPLDSNPSFHALTRSTHSSREVAMITRSSAKNSSQGTPTLKSLDKASSTKIKSSGLRTEPWCTPTPTSNSSLYSEPTLARLRALLYIACTRRTIHSSTPTFLIAHYKTFRGTRSNAYISGEKGRWNQGPVLLLQSDTVTSLVTHWPLGDLDAILKLQYSILFYWLVSSHCLMMMPWDECQGTSPMISQHWFR